MKNIKLWLVGILAATAFAATMSSCKDDPEINRSITVDTETLNVNKKGLGSNGKNATFTVSSDVYWTAEIEQGTDWLTISPVAGSGTTVVTLTVSEHDGNGRSARIFIGSAGNAPKEVTVRQTGNSETLTYIFEDAGSRQVDTRTEVKAFRNWTKSGIATINVYYTGTGSYVDTEMPSGYENASGGNNILFNDIPAIFTIPGMKTKGDIHYNLSLGYFRPSHPAGGEFTEWPEEPLTVQLSNDGKRWFNFEYTAVNTDNAWQAVSSEFTIIPGTETLSLRFYSLAEGLRIDDIRLSEGIGGGKLYDFSGSGDPDPEISHDLRPGDMMWSDDFSWVTAAGTATTPDFAAKTNGKDGPRMDGWPTSVTEGVDALRTGNPGWGYPGQPQTASEGNTQCYIYPHVGIFKLGRTKNEQGAGGFLVSPGKATAKLTEPSIINIKFDALPFYTSTGGDHNEVKVAVHEGPGVVTSANIIEIGPSDWNGVTGLGTFEFTVAGATADTRFVIGPATLPTSTAVSNRFYLDNVKVFYVSPGEAPGADPLEGLPAVWTMDGYPSRGNGGEAVATPLLNSTERWFKADPGTNAAATAYGVRSAEGSGGISIARDPLESTADAFVLMASMLAGDSWRFEVPVKNLKTGMVINLTGVATSSTYGPKFFLVETSADGTSWTPRNAKTENFTVGGNQHEVTYTYAITAGNHQATDINEDISITEDIDDGILYIRLVLTSNIRNSLTSISTGDHGGTTRIRSNFTISQK